MAASCAIPAFYRPVRIGGRRYVDGGVCSPSNLDLLRDRSLDLVVCLNPISSRAETESAGPAARVAASIRAATGRRLGHEARELRGGGTEVLLLQPTREDIDVMGFNLMDRGRRITVLDQARQSTRAELAALRRSGVTLPGRRRRHRPSAVPARRRAA